jgi:hypothetical protein
MGGSSLNATELAQLADNVALMWLKTREDREPMCLIHVRFGVFGSLGLALALTGWTRYAAAPYR